MLTFYSLSKQPLKHVSAVCVSPQFPLWYMCVWFVCSKLFPAHNWCGGAQRSRMKLASRCISISTAELQFVCCSRCNGTGSVEDTKKERLRMSGVQVPMCSTTHRVSTVNKERARAMLLTTNFSHNFTKETNHSKIVSIYLYDLTYDDDICLCVYTFYQFGWSFAVRKEAAQSNSSQSHKSQSRGLLAKLYGDYLQVVVI